MDHHYSRLLFIPLDNHDSDKSLVDELWHKAQPRSVSSDSGTNSDNTLASPSRITAMSDKALNTPVDQTVDYPDAATDTYGVVGGIRFIFKTGPAWPQPLRSSHPALREMRPVAHGHPIEDKWFQIIQATVAYFKELDLPLTVIAGLAFANQGETNTFCELVVVIGIGSTDYHFNRVKEAAEHTQMTILGDAGFSEVPVAVCVWNVHRSNAQLPSLGRVPDPDFSDSFYAFSANPGLAIAHLHKPTLAGTVGAYLRLPVGDRNVILGITNCHVVSDSPSYATSGLSVDAAAERNHRIIAIGSGAYDTAMAAISEQISTLKSVIGKREAYLVDLRMKQSLLGDEGDTENHQAILRHQEMIDGLSKVVQQLDRQRQEIIAKLGKPEDRDIGRVYFAEPIGPSGDDFSAYTVDWAVVQFDEGAFAPNFSGNIVFVGEKHPFCRLVCQQNDPDNEHDCHYPKYGLLQISDYVSEDEIKSTGEVTRFPVIKNGMSTGTTFGWLNGLKSYVRSGERELGVASYEAMETTIIPNSHSNRPFSADGDSGSAILDKEGRFVALLNGGAGARVDKHDITLATAGYSLLPRITNVLPGVSLLPAVGDT